jgi:hypothetical protein
MATSHQAAAGRLRSCDRPAPTVSDRSGVAMALARPSAALGGKSDRQDDVRFPRRRGLCRGLGRMLER